MKEMRGLLEKDVRLFRYQGAKFFLMIAGIAVFLTLSGAMETGFINAYITSVMAIYSSSTINYDEAEHGYEYLFSLPVSRKAYVREKYIFSFLLVMCGWCIGMICLGISLLVKKEQTFQMEILGENLLSLIVIIALAGIMIAIRIRFEAEKGRLVFPIVFLILFGLIYFGIYFIESQPKLMDFIGQGAAVLGDGGVIALIVVGSVIVLLLSYLYSLRVIHRKEF